MQHTLWRAIWIVVARVRKKNVPFKTSWIFDWVIATSCARIAPSYTAFKTDWSFCRCVAFRIRSATVIDCYRYPKRQSRVHAIASTRNLGTKSEHRRHGLSVVGAHIFPRIHTRRSSDRIGSTQVRKKLNATNQSQTFTSCTRCVQMHIQH